jgi:hypothetical protein
LGQTDRPLKALNAKIKGLSIGGREPLRVLEQGRYFRSIKPAVVGGMGWR